MTSGNQLVADRYRLEERIGSGAMGVVWRARDERLDRVVAVKQLLLAPGLSRVEAEQSRARAMREGRIAARLQHPNAVGVFDVALDSADGGDPWLVMEYLPSASLAAVVDERGPLPPREVARIGEQVADALAAAHAAGIVHRDVKPGNVLLGPDGAVKITDFGISRASWDATVTSTGALAGTPAYFAPEVARGDQPTPASDVFSLGSTLYAAVEGQPPFGTDENTLALLRAVSDGQVRPPQQAGELTALLMRLLQDKPADRPAMTVVRDSLNTVADGVDAPPPTVADAPSPPWAGRSPAPPAQTVTTPAPQPDHDPSEAAPWWQRPGVLPAAGAVLLLLLAGIAFAVVGSGGDGQRGTAQPSTAPSTTVPPPPSPQQLERTVREYYGLLPGDTDAAWEYLGAGVRQQAGGRSGYERFWSGIDLVLIDGPVRVEGNVAMLKLQFEPARGNTSYERYRLTMGRGPGGRLLIQTSERIGFYVPAGAGSADTGGDGSAGDGGDGGGDADAGDRGGDDGGGDDGGGDDDNPGRGDDDNPGRGNDDNPGRGNDGNPGRGNDG